MVEGAWAVELARRLTRHELSKEHPFSRRVFLHPSFAHHKKPRPSPDIRSSSDDTRQWRAGCITIGRGAKQERKTGGGTPPDAYLQIPHQRVRLARKAPRARLTAFHRGTYGSEPTPPLSLRRTSWDVAATRA